MCIDKCLHEYMHSCCASIHTHGVCIMLLYTPTQLVDIYRRYINNQRNREVARNFVGLSVVVEFETLCKRLRGHWRPMPLLHVRCERCYDTRKLFTSEILNESSGSHTVRRTLGIGSWKGRKKIQNYSSCSRKV